MAIVEFIDSITLKLSNNRFCWCGNTPYLEGFEHLEAMVEEAGFDAILFCQNSEVDCWQGPHVCLRCGRIFEYYADVKTGEYLKAIGVMKNHTLTEAELKELRSTVR